MKFYSGDDLQRHLDGARSRGSFQFDAPYRLGRTIDLHGLEGMTIAGLGESGGDKRPSIIYEGAADPGAPLFRLTNCRDTLFAQMHVVARAPWYSLLEYFRVDTFPGAVTPTNNRHMLVTVEGPTDRAGVPFIGNFVVYKKLPGEQYRGNNDCGLFWCCGGGVMRRFASFQHLMSKKHRFFECRVNATESVVDGAGSYTWDGGGGGGCRGSVFDVTTQNDGLVLGGDWENSAMLLRTNGPTSAPQSYTLRNVRFMLNRLGPDRPMENVPNVIIPGRRIVSVRAPGPLVIEGGDYGQAGEPIPQFYMAGVGGNMLEVIGGPSFGGYGSEEIPLFVFGGKANTDVRFGTMRRTDRAGFTVTRPYEFEVVEDDGRGNFLA